MKIIIAPNSFKESLPAAAAAEAIAAGVREILPEAELVQLPVADGGDGTLEALVTATGGEYVACSVTDPLSRPMTARLGILGDGQTAVVEMAEASGLRLLDETERLPLITTSAGTGELIRAALDQGFRRIILGVGGSATVDGGAGMAQALGYALLDKFGQPIRRGGGALCELARIAADQVDPRLALSEFLVACDVDNPLTGECGAAHVFGPQKGASPREVKLLDQLLGQLAQRWAEDLGREPMTELPGAGAGGGLGAGAAAFLGAVLRPGLELILEYIGLQDALAEAALVITGEGRLDATTLHNKAPLGVARLAQSAGVPCLALAGSLDYRLRTQLRQAGFTACHAIVPGPGELADCYRCAAEWLQAAAAEAVALWLAGRLQGHIG